MTLDFDDSNASSFISTQQRHIRSEAGLMSPSGSWMPKLWLLLLVLVSVLGTGVALLLAGAIMPIQLFSEAPTYIRRKDEPFLPKRNNAPDLLLETFLSDPAAQHSGRLSQMHKDGVQPRF